MNGTSPITRLERMGMVAALTAGLLLSGGGLALAERDRPEKRHETRFETRQEERGERHRGDRYERRGDGRHDGRDRDRREVTVVRELPRGYRTVHVGRDDYYVHDHRYYRRHRDGFVLVRPPAGAIFATLPIGNVRVTIGGSTLFTCDDVYYRPTRGGYVVVEPPVFGPTAAIVIVRSPLLNIRSGPGLGFPVLCQVSAGTALSIGGDAPGWYYVAVPGGPNGWVMRQHTHRRADG
jgi:hypothetical protein